MYRFLVRPKWIAFHLLVIFLVILMVNLGFWQWRRLDERKAFNAEVKSHQVLPVTTIEDLFPEGTDVDVDGVEWRRVTVAGTYVADEQVIILNRAQAGAAGHDAVAPILLDDGRLVLVDRGFITDPQPTPAPPTGRVEIVGRVRTSAVRRLGGLTDSDPSGKEFFRVDVPLIAAQIDATVLPVYVDRLESTPADDLVPVPEPELGEGSHLSYMFQWWFFSLCAIAGWVLAVRRSAHKVSAPAARAPADSLAPASDEVPLEAS